MTNRPATLKTEQLDMDSLFDFSQSTTQPSPATASSSKLDATPLSANQDWTPFDQQQQFNGPSHDYNQYKQQVGLPSGSIHMSNGMFDGYNSGIGDMGFDSGFGGGWSTGIDLDTDMTVDFNNPQSAMPAMFFPPPESNNNPDNFVDPNSIGGQEEPVSHVGRLWPGMHSQQAQQAAMQKAAQIQAVQQRQLKLQAQQAHYRQQSVTSVSVQSQSSAHHSKRPSHVTEPHVEESISRLLNQMRNNSNASNAEDDENGSGLLPQLARMKKDEEEMDEDERLLASEEGKKLSSKERRQLRNKVSARAFRSRRKEYIGQLEGEVAIKTQESQNLRSQNAALMAENDRYRALIETLLRHPAFGPFLQDISHDPSVLGPPPPQPMQQQQQPRPTPTPAQQPAQPAPPQQQQQNQSSQQDSKPDYLNFDASQLQLPQQQQQSEQVGLAMIPENDFSKLNINGFNSVNFNNYHRVNAFAVTELPRPDPVDLLVGSPAHLLLSQTASNTSTAGNSDTASCDYSTTALLARLDAAARRCGTVSI